MIVNHKDFVIEITDQPHYILGSADNLNAYDAIYGEQIYGNQSKHCISLFKNGVKESSVLVTASGGGTTIHEHSFVIKDDAIYICCSAMVFSVGIPALTLIWSKELDTATCFQMFTYEEDLIIHGELEISRITTDGAVKWQFGGRNIFVNLNGYKEFKITGDKIKLVDFENYEYFIDANGKFITDRLLK